jgi:hypothetical protein
VVHDAVFAKALRKRTENATEYSPGASLYAPDLKPIAEGTKPTRAKIWRRVVALIAPAHNAGRLEQYPAV